jgi:hypothetical protein
VNVAGPQFQGALEQIIDGPNDRSPARKIAEAVDVVVARAALGLRDIHGVGRSLIEPPLQNRCDVVEGSDSDRDGTAADDLRGSDRSAIGLDPTREAETVVLIRNGKTDDSRKKRAENCSTAPTTLKQFLQVEPRQPPEARHLVGKLSTRQIRFFPQFSKSVSSDRFGGIDALQFCPCGVRYPFEQMQTKLLYRTLWRAAVAPPPPVTFRGLASASTCPASPRGFTYLSA